LQLGGVQRLALAVAKQLVLERSDDLPQAVDLAKRRMGLFLKMLAFFLPRFAFG